MSKDIKEFVIVGGGSAGWIAGACLARLLLKTARGGYKITLVESPEIGIIGVGEATVPSMQDLIAFLNIDEADFVKATNATYKLGICFKDWNKIGGEYWHPFGELGPMIENQPLHQHWLQQKIINPQTPDLHNISICSMAARANKFQKPVKNTQSVYEWLSYAYHFDAVKGAEYLRDYGKNKGVNHITGRVVEVKTDQEGMIETLKLEDGREIQGDFFIDCSGFVGLLIEKTLKSEFDDWTHWLPVDRAIAVPTKPNGPLTPYTTSHAREAGWTWRIPLQNRVGNGYVYSSKFASDDEAMATADMCIAGERIAEPRTIKFKAGRRREPWVKNCLSLGLASGFLEPLESTAIHLVIANIFRFFDHFPKTENFEVLRKAFNHRGIREIEEIRDFIILHYCVSERKDTDFWRYVTTMDIPDTLSERLEIYKGQAKILADYYDLFRPMSWISVLAGMDVIPENSNPIINIVPPEFSINILRDVSVAIAEGVAKAPSHEAYLKQLVG